MEYIKLSKDEKDSISKILMRLSDIDRKELLEYVEKNKQSNLSEQHKLILIQRVVAGKMNVTIDQMYSDTREREVVTARYLVFFFASNDEFDIKMSQYAITNHYSLNHASCCHGKKTIKNLIATDKAMRNTVDALRVEIADLLKLETDKLQECGNI